MARARLPRTTRTHLPRTTQATVPSGLGLLFTPWLFDPALLLSGLATMAAVVYLLILLRTGRFNARTMSLTAVCYLAFAVCLVPIVA